MKAPWLWMALLFTTTGCASPPRTAATSVTVEAEGSAPEGPEAGARALARAHKAAVERALGVSVAASTRVEAAIAVRSRIWADARGRVASWKVLRDESRAGLRVVRISAVVVPLPPGEAVPPPADVKVRVEAAGPAGEGLRRGLGEKGFVLVASGEDFVVRGSGASQLLRDERTAPFVTGRGRVTVEVTESATGAVVWQKALEAAELDADPLAASARAVAAAGELGGRDAAAGLSTLLWGR